MKTDEQKLKRVWESGKVRSTESSAEYLVEKDGTITEYQCFGGRVTPKTTYVILNHP